MENKIKGNINKHKKKEKDLIAKKKNKETFSTKIFSKRLVRIRLFLYVLLGLLTCRLFCIEIIDGPKLKEMAYKQQTINQIISPARGTIYDSTGKALAISSRVDTVTINPGKIKYSTNKLVEPEIISKALTDIFSLEYEEVYKKVTSNSSVETIIKKVDQDKITALKKWMKDNKVSAGINIDEDSKRSYPHSNFAANLIGFCGTDNNGLSRVRIYLE